MHDYYHIWQLRELLQHIAGSCVGCVPCTGMRSVNGAGDKQTDISDKKHKAVSSLTPRALKDQTAHPNHQQTFDKMADNTRELPLISPLYNTAVANTLNCWLEEYELYYNQENDNM